MENKTGWGIFEDEEFKHVYPVNEEHSQEIGWTGFINPVPYSKCSCVPRIDVDQKKGIYIVVHGAFDGREAMEEVNSILNNQK